jgi:hypothetical protein
MRQIIQGACAEVKNGRACTDNKRMPVARGELSTAMLDYGECAEAIELQFKEPIIIIERSSPLQERHWLEMKGHGAYENSKNPDKTQGLVMGRDEESPY